MDKWWHAKRGSLLIQQVNDVGVMEIIDTDTGYARVGLSLTKKGCKDLLEMLQEYLSNG